MATTTNITLNQPAYGSTSPTWDNPLNYNAAILDKVFGNTTSVSVNTGSTPTYTLITAPSSSGAGSTSQCMRFSLTGLLAANQTVLLPQGIAGMWVVTNGTTGSFTVTIGSNNGSNASAGTTVTLAAATQGLSQIIYCDGTNVKKADDAQSATSSGVPSFQTSLSGLTPQAATSGVAVTLAGTLGATSGGTGLTSPGTAGNVLTSTGTGWASLAPGAGTYTQGNGISINTSNVVAMSGSYTGSFTASTNITATTGNISASAGSITANTNVTATTGDVKATNGKIIAGNNGHYLNSGGTGTATTRLWQVSAVAAGDSTNTSIYWDNSQLKYYFNPSGTNGVLTLTNAEFRSNVINVSGGGAGIQSTNWTLGSDIKLKTNISPISNSYERIMGLKPVDFTWIENQKNDAGFIAQEFETIYPQNVSEHDGIKCITINMNFYADLVSTIQILQKKIESLEARLTAQNL